MDRAHSRETNKPDPDPLSKLLDFDADTCWATLWRSFRLSLSIFIAAYHYIDECASLSY